ncbi:MAG: DNA topoisomerase VI, subunit B [Promethearchaeota archaeon]|nr:MAG: DNA topoisomerase VI, subunit B [Candidatus Lokiarchaeota archaeon]
MDEIIKPSEKTQTLEEKETPTEEEAPSSKKKEEIEEIEVKKLVEDMESLIKPVDHINIIDKEPLVIIRLTESEAHSLLTGEIDAKNVMSYKFEVFDNGMGMNPSDLKKYGKYLASSKSVELKQTRGSQGFGAPSAFSDSQNTTGKPIVTVSKTANNLYAMAAEFFTTSKNEKRYVVSPTEIDVPFLHGTYIKLNYLNIKYNRGFVDVYVKETALMNPHVTIIFIDPYNEEHIYPRKVSSFPAEPKYAKPHPSSTNIGDLQDLLAKSEHLALTSFLQDNFVRMSYNTAKDVVDLAEKDLQDQLNLLILNDSYLTLRKKPEETLYYLRNEERVYGRSNKPREKLIVYEVLSEDLKNFYWDEINSYHQKNKKIEKINRKIKKLKSDIQDADTKKEQKEIKRKVKKYREKIDNIREVKDEIRKKLYKAFKDKKEGLNEITTKKIVSEFKDKVKEVKISDMKPSELTNNQFNSLFFAFKSIKYMAPPTDTVVPVGDVVLENTLIKELGLKVSENLDDFGSPNLELEPLEARLIRRKKRSGQLESISESNGETVLVELEKNELLSTNSQILAPLVLEDGNFEPEGFGSDLEHILEPSEDSNTIEYKQLFEYFVENFTKDDDFVGAETRDPVSGKGLAYVVEAVLAYGNHLETPKRSRDVLSRFVNRTPKLRDTAGCAITYAVKSVNWKNYNLDSFDNGLPKGPIKLLVNVSGPYVHLMFKSQSKNSLAEDENLMDEIKYCLEAIGRRLRVYLNRRAQIRRKEKRANLIEKYIPKFVESLYNIAQEGSKYKEKISKEELETLITAPIKKGVSDVIDEISLEKPDQKIEGEKEEKKEIKKEIEKKPKEKLKEKPKEKLKEKPKEKPKEKLKEKPKEKLKEKPKEKLKEKPKEKPKVEKTRELSQEKVVKVEEAKAKVQIKPEKIDFTNLDDYSVNELKEIAEKEDIKIPSRARKDDIIKTIQSSVGIHEKSKSESKVEKKERIEEKTAKAKKSKPKEQVKPERIDFTNLDDYTVKELKGIAEKEDINIPSRARKDDIIKTIQSSVGIHEKSKSESKVEKKKPKPRKVQKKETKPVSKKEKRPKAPPTYPKTKQQKLPVITTEGILGALNNKEWQTIKQLIFKMRIKDMLDARLLQVKLKELERKGEIQVQTKKGKKFWKLK